MQPSSPYEKLESTCCDLQVFSVYDQRPAKAIFHELKLRADCSFEDAKELIEKV